MGGYVFAMAGASEEHNLIAVNLCTLLRSHLRGSACRVFMSDMKVKIHDDIFHYPDLLVTCHSEDNHRYFKTQPNLIIELLSESTESTDQREKLMNYQTLKESKYRTKVQILTLSKLIQTYNLIAYPIQRR